MRRGIVKVSVVVLAVFGVLYGVRAFLFSNLVIDESGYEELPPGGPPPRLFPAAVGSVWGFIDQTGTMVVPLQFSRAEPFSEGLAPVVLNGKAAYIDELGRVAIFLDNAVYGRQFSDGLAEVKVGNLWGYIDRTGTFAIKPRFRHTNPFREGLASVSDSTHSGLYTIDKSGKAVSIAPPGMDGPDFAEFSEGLNATMPSNCLFGYADRAGRWVINPTFDWAGNFSEGLAYARLPAKRAKWGYIDHKGRWAIKPQFLGVGSFSEGLAAVRVFTFSFPPSKWGFIDRQGRMVIPPAYDGVLSFCGGLCAVQKGSKMGFIDRTGQIVIPFQFNAGGYFAGPLASVIYNDKAGDHPAYINRKGEMVWASPDVVGRA